MLWQPTAFHANLDVLTGDTDKPIKAIALDGCYWERWFLDHLKEAGFSEEQIENVEAIRLDN